MKNAKIGFLLLSVFAFQNVQAKKKESPQQKAVAARQKAAAQRRKMDAAKTAAVVQEDAHKVEVSERPLLKKEQVSESISNNYTEQPDGSVIQTQVTVTPMPEENKVVTTTETWTWKDAAIVGGKVLLGAAAIGGAGYLMYNNNETFKNGVDNSAGWASNKGNNLATSVSGQASSMWNSVANSNFAKSMQAKYDQWTGKENPQMTTTAINNDIATDPMGALDAAQAISENSSNPQDQEIADVVAAKIEDALESGEQPALNNEESNWFMSKFSEYKNELAVATGVVATGVGAKYGLGKAAGKIVAKQGQRSVGGFTPQSSNVARPNRVNPGMANLSAKQAEIASNTPAALAQAEINAQQALAQKYQQGVTANLNRTQAAQQLANQAAMAQQVGLSAANVGVAAGLAAGASALNS